MLMPSIFGENLFDDFMDFPFGSFGKNQMMRTDIQDTENGYEVAIDMPGFRKEDVSAELKDGYLTIRAATDKKEDKKDENGRYLRRERYVGSCSRSFYIGEEVKQEDIKARFDNGVLKLSVPKKVEQPKVEENKYIAIEG